MVPVSLVEVTQGSFSLALPESTLSLKVGLTPQPSILLFAHGSFSFYFGLLTATILLCNRMGKLGFSGISLRKETVSCGRWLGLNEGSTPWYRSKEEFPVVHCSGQIKRKERKDKVSPHPKSSLKIPHSKNIWI